MGPLFSVLIIHLEKRRNARWKEEVVDLRRARVEERARRLEATLALSINQRNNVYACLPLFKWPLTTFRTEVAGNKTAP